MTDLQQCVLTNKMNNECTIFSTGLTDQTEAGSTTRHMDTERHGYEAGHVRMTPLGLKNKKNK